MALSRCILLLSLLCPLLLVVGCAALKGKQVNMGSQTTGIVIKGTPADPSTSSGPSAELIYSDHGNWFHDAPAAPGSIWGYHWISYAWLPAIFGSNVVSSEVIVVTYGGDGDKADSDTRMAARGQVSKFLGMALEPRTSSKITTAAPAGTTTVTTDQAGNSTREFKPAPTP